MGPACPRGREEQLFEKFERGAKESATPGVGLGLAICRAIVQAHGGTIRGRESRRRTAPSTGARFRISLPRGEPPSDDGSDAGDRGRAGGIAMTDTRGRILVVEDEPEIRRFVRLTLEAEGYEVLEADGVQRGLHRGRHPPPRPGGPRPRACPTATAWT